MFVTGREEVGEFMRSMVWRNPGSYFLFLKGIWRLFLALCFTPNANSEMQLSFPNHGLWFALQTGDNGVGQLDEGNQMSSGRKRSKGGEQNKL